MKLFVGNVSYQATEQNIRELFGAFGELVSVQMMLDRETGKPRGFLFVEFERKRDAIEAMMQLEGQEFLGRQLSVREAQEPKGGGARGGGNRRQQGGGYQGDGERRSSGGYQGGGERRSSGGYQGGGERRSSGGYQGGGERRSSGGYQGGGERRSSGGYQGGSSRPSQDEPPSYQKKPSHFQDYSKEAPKSAFHAADPVGENDHFDDDFDLDDIPSIEDSFSSGRASEPSSRKKNFAKPDEMMEKTPRKFKNKSKAKHKSSKPAGKREREDGFGTKKRSFKRQDDDFGRRSRKGKNWFADIEDHDDE